jgi:uncharacterized protein YjiS (DUF1127 family)
LYFRTAKTEIYHKSLGIVAIYMRYLRSCTATGSFCNAPSMLILSSDSGASFEGRWELEQRNKNMLLSIINFFKSWKRYGVAVDELSHLSDRELADIGITRGDIPRIAWEQAKH